MRRLFTTTVAAFAAVLSMAVTAGAAEPAKHDDNKRAEKQEDEMPAERTSLSVAVTPLLPVGNLGDVFAFGVGGLLGVDYAVHPHVQILGRVGYVHHLPKSGLDVSLGALPIWGGARYTFGVGDGAYLGGALGPTVLFATTTTTVNGVRASDSEVRLGTELGGGYRFSKVDIGGRFVFWDIGHASDSMGLMVTAAFTFASF